MKKVLLQLGEHGEPASESKGILILNSFPFDISGNFDTPIYSLILSISAASPITHQGTIWTNIPPDPKTRLSRDKYYPHEIRNSFSEDIKLRFLISKPGVYSYYVTCASTNDKNEHCLDRSPTYYIVVQPSLWISKDEYLPLNSISIQTVLSKLMGKRDSWDTKFEHIASKGYNMIHFTPLQYRGVSNSPYSIFDQLAFDPELFESPDDVENLVKHIKSEFGLLSLTDIVWNHTADNSEWLRDHPESGYNAETAPHLCAAIELDEKLLEFSLNIHKYGLPNELYSVNDLKRVMESMKIHVFGELKLWQFYTLDVTESLTSLKQYLLQKSIDDVPSLSLTDDQLNNYDELTKFASSYAGNHGGFKLLNRGYNKVDSKKLASVVISFMKSKNIGCDVASILREAKSLINEMNVPLYHQYDEDMLAANDQLFNRIKYLRLDSHGPKLGKITKDVPLTEPYFTRFISKEGKHYALANNGWVWNANALIDFASDKSKAYLRRELIVWGDCVKLRYGEKPEDSPYLWKRMIQYTQLCAKIFDGFRIDNCHSTPLHVGEILIDSARDVNPNLYVVAELFSGSEEVDRMYVERLGLSSLIREAMQAWSEGELSRLVHRHAGRPIGSFKWLPLDDLAYLACIEPDCSNPKLADKASEIDIPKLLYHQEPHALFMDCTHDNETPNQKRTVEDTLPNAAIVGLCSCAVGSVFGYDECYPELLDVVKETREYGLDGAGIGEVKRKIYSIRDQLAKESLDWEDHEMYIHHDGQYITLHRTNASNGIGIYLVVRTKFNYDNVEQALEPIVLSGSKVQSLFSYCLKKIGDAEKSKNKVENIPVVVEELSESIIDYDLKSCTSTIKLPHYFPQGSIAVFTTQYVGVNEELTLSLRSGAIEASKSLDLIQLNALLYKCESEERDYSAGREGTYYIPGMNCHLVYGGLQGWISVISDVIKRNDLNHPFAINLRDGTWALDFVVNRLLKFCDSESVLEFERWLKSRIHLVKEVPFFLRPKYFALVLGTAYEACRFRALSLLSPMFHNANLFVQNLGLTSIQMVGMNRVASLKPFKRTPSMAAGLPHFSYDFMRCWGRDIFISLRGLLLATNRFEDAKSHILAAASTLKHGLIPNLIDSCRNPRYNARDATWFWLQSVKDFVGIAPDGSSILKEKVKRRFPKNDKFIQFDDPEAFSYESTIEEIIFEIFSRHAKGLDFREANAGVTLDSQMKDEGFNVRVYVDWDNGLIFGGSQFNCGTWMDKMGESEKAGNKGVPGTPRDGAAIEINGLLKSSLSFVNKMRSQNFFKFDEVETQDGNTISFEQWEKLVANNFERAYFIPENPDDDSEFDVNPKLINRRGIYKDLYRSGKEYEDYQLRPNFAIAMVVAPELFTPLRAMSALKIADKTIRGPLGMCTLDPSDYNYRPYYDNSVDDYDFSTSKGRNYHQGPEWVWCTGYFLRAFAYFYMLDPNNVINNDAKSTREQLHRVLMERLAHHKNWIKKSDWRGLTELTNKNGEFCKDSSPTQAWSGGCLIDLFYDFYIDAI